MGKLGTQLSSRCNPSDYTHRRIAIQIIEVCSWFCNMDTLYSSFWPCLISSSVCHDSNTSMSGALSSRDGSLWAGETCTWPWGSSGVPKVRRGVLLLFSVFSCVLFAENGVDSGRLWSSHGPNFAEFPGCPKGSERLACRFKCASEWHESQHFARWENWLLDLDSERFSKVWWIFQRMNMMMIVRHNRLFRLWCDMTLNTYQSLVVSIESIANIYCSWF